MGGNSRARREKSGQAPSLFIRRIERKNPLFRQKEKNYNTKRQTEKSLDDEDEEK